jgi:hypothetical protein
MKKLKKSLRLLLNVRKASKTNDAELDQKRG